MLLAKPYLQLLWGLVRSIPLSEGLTTATVAALIWHFTRALKRVENDFADKITAVQTDHAKRVADLQTEINWLYVARAELQMKINRCEYEVLRAIMDRRESFLGMLVNGSGFGTILTRL